MIRPIVALGIIFAAGCAGSRQADLPAPPIVQGEAAAAALVFDPSRGTDFPPEYLSRSGRGDSAYWGVRGPTTTYHVTHTDDRWGTDLRNDFGDFYRRRSVMTRLGVSIRP